MSKKRERAKTEVDGDSDGVGDKIVQDAGAESLLFEIATPSSDDTTNSSSKNKRSKNNPTNPRSTTSQDSNGNANDGDGDDVDAAVGAGDADSGAMAASKSQQYHPAAIAASSALRQCDGFDVVRKGARGRGRQLMVLPGALGLGNGGSGGKLGMLNNATPARPVLYVEFPEVWNCVVTPVWYFSRYGTALVVLVQQTAIRPIPVFSQI